MGVQNYSMFPFKQSSSLQAIGEVTTHTNYDVDIQVQNSLQFILINILLSNQTEGRRGGLMVSALVSGLSGPGRGHCFVFWARHFTLTVPLSTQLYKLMLGVTLL